MKNFVVRLSVCGVLMWTATAFGWDELSSLDQVVGNFEALDVAEQRGQVATLADALDKISTDKAPASVKGNLIANFLLGDIESIAKKLKKVDTLSDTDLTEAVGAIHPLLEALLGELEIPHVCNHAHHDHGTKKAEAKKDEHHDRHDHDGHHH